MGSMQALVALIAVVAIGAVAYVMSSGGGASYSAEPSPLEVDATENVASEAQKPTIADPSIPPVEESTPTRAVAETDAANLASGATASRKLQACTVTGRVIDDAGNPLRGVPVKVSTLGEMVIIDESGQRQGPGERTTKSGVDGRFELKDVMAGFGFSVKAEPAGLVAASKPLPNQSGGTLDLGDLVCEIGGTLVGRVIDESGNGIAGAEVRAWSVDTTVGGGAGLLFLGDGGSNNGKVGKTDAAGAFQITGLKSGEIALSASAEGFTRESAKGIALKKGESTPEVKVALSSGLAIEGLVIDRSGGAVADATVRIMETVVDLSEGGFSSELQKSREIKTDGNGNFRIAGLKSANYHVLGNATGYLPTTKESVPAGSKDVRIELDRSGMVHGYVRNSTTNKAVEDFEVHVSSEEGFGFGFVPGRGRTEVVYGEKAAAITGLADSDGLFAIPSAPGRSITLDFTANGYAGGTSVRVDVPPGEKIRRDVDLVPEIRLSGIVYTPNGDPLPDALVSIEEKTATGGDEARTFVRARRAVAAADVDHGEVHFEGEQPTDRTDAEGRFALKGLKPGDYELFARHSLWAESDRLSVELAVGDDLEGLELSLKAAGVLIGVAHDADGKPFGGARITVEPKRTASGDGEVVMAGGFAGVPGEEMFGGGKTKSATAAADGTFRVEGLAPGDYFANLKKPPTAGPGGGAFSISMLGTPGEQKGALVKIEAGEETEHDLFLPPTGRVRGTVTETNGPLEGVAVSLKKSSEDFFPMAVASAKTDGRGHFEMADIEPGEYKLSIKPAGAAAPLERKVVVRGREVVDEDVKLPTGAVRGKVRDVDSNRGIAGVVVEVRKHRDPNSTANEPPQERRMMAMMMVNDGGGGAVQTMKFGDDQELVKTDADGNYEVRFLEPGDYDVEIHGAGISPDKKDGVTVREGATTERVDFDAIRGATLLITAIPANSDDSIAFVTAEVAPTNDPTNTRREATGGNAITIDGLKPGTYTVSLRSNDLAGETTVTVESGDVKPLEITLK